MAEPILIYRRLLDRWSAVAAALLEGGQCEGPDGVMYPISALPAILTKIDILRVHTAIEAVEGGAQAYSVEGRTFTKADLGTLYRRLKELELLAQQATPGRSTSGRVRQIVPAE